MTIEYKDSKRIVGLEADRTGGSITLDAESNNHASASATSITISGFTVGNNSNKILIVSVGSYNPTPTVSGITWNSSENFTQINTVANNGRADLWYLVNPTSTTADIVVTYSSSAGSRSAGVTSLYNVNQSTPIGVTNTVTGTGGTIAGTITPTTTGSWIIDSAMSLTGLGAITDTLTAGFSNLIGGVDRSHGTQYSASPTINSANSMTWTNGQSSYAWAGAEIKKAEGDLTNVQDNSLFVDKVNARRYWFESGSSETLSQETESGTGELFNDVEIVAQKFTTGSSKIGKKVSSVAFYLKRNTSTIGSTNLQCFVGAGNQSSAVAYGTLPATSLTTSYAWYTFTPSVAGTERTLVADDRIMIRWADGSTTSDAVRMASDQLGNNPLANETGQYSADDGSNFTNRSFDYMYKIISTTPATWTMEPTYGTNFASSSGWTENTTTASDIDIQTASNRVYLNLTHNSSETSVLSRTLPTTSNTAWILRFKVNATSVGTDGSLLVGLSTNASASDTQQRFLGLWLKQESGSSIRAVTDNDNASGGLCSGGNNTSGYTGTTTTGTDYYVTVVRDVNNIKVTARTGSHTGTAVGSGTVITAVDGTATGLNTLKIMNHKCSTGGAWIGYLYDLEFYNGVTSIN